MIRKGYLAILLSIYGCNSYSQLTKVENVNEDIKEIFYVDDNQQKQGEYIFKYKNKVQAVGYFNDNQRTGRWVFTPDKSFKIVGHYKNDQRDSIWNTYNNNILISSQNFITKERKSFYANGKFRQPILISDYKDFTEGES